MPPADPRSGSFRRASHPPVKIASAHPRPRTERLPQGRRPAQAKGLRAPHATAPRAGSGAHRPCRKRSRAHCPSLRSVPQALRETGRASTPPTPDPRISPPRPLAPASPGRADCWCPGRRRSLRARRPRPPLADTRDHFGKTRQQAHRLFHQDAPGKHQRLDPKRRGAARAQGDALARRREPALSSAKRSRAAHSTLSHCRPRQGSRPMGRNRTPVSAKRCASCCGCSIRSAMCFAFSMTRSRSAAPGQPRLWGRKAPCFGAGPTAFGCVTGERGPIPVIARSARSGKVVARHMAFCPTRSGHRRQIFRNSSCHRYQST